MSSTPLHVLITRIVLVPVDNYYYVYTVESPFVLVRTVVYRFNESPDDVEKPGQ